MNINNIFLFVSDSLRWNYLPAEICGEGVVFKTVAQSLSSPASFATLTTGLYPPEHGVTGWRTPIPEEIPRIFDIDGVDGGFFDQGEPGEVGIYSVLRTDKSSFESLDEPFIHLHRDPGPHQPLGDAETSEEYHQRNAGDWAQYQADYSSAVEESMDRFQSCINELQNQGKLESTLVILTSDHGELLGEHGGIEHNSPATPQLAYVPTVFFHPDVKKESFQVDSDDSIIEHVDVIETCLQAAGHTSFQTSGVDLLTTDRPREWGYNRMESTRNGRTTYHSEGIWWYDSGYAFHQNKPTNRVLHLAAQFLISKQRHSLRRQPLKLSRSLLRDSNSFQSPPISEEAAENAIHNFLAGLTKIEARETSVSEEATERLEELGYIDT
jgi:arylsulfatase A-like enzyme